MLGVSALITGSQQAVETRRTALESAGQNIGKAEDIKGSIDQNTQLQVQTGLTLNELIGVLNGGVQSLQAENQRKLTDISNTRKALRVRMTVHRCSMRRRSDARPRLSAAAARRRKRPRPASGRPTCRATRRKRRAECGPMSLVNADPAAALASDRDASGGIENRAGRWKTSLANCSNGSTPRARIFRSRAYEALSQEIEPLLRLLFILAVLFYGVQLFLGTSRISVAEIIGRLARMLVIFILVGTWANFNSLVYEWLTEVPEAAGRAILAASGTGITEPTNGLSQIWKTANVAAAAFSEQAGYFSVLPALIGMIIMLFAGIFVAIALGILVAREGHALGAARHRADLHRLHVLRCDAQLRNWLDQPVPALRDDPACSSTSSPLF